MLGVLRTDEARRMAREKDMDLVEVNPKTNPPVCKIMDYGRFKYEEKKKQAETKRRQTKIELKELKLRPKTDDHDIDFKTKHARRFLEEGNKVKITVRFRGREITHPETAERQINAIVEGVADIAMIEQGHRMEGRTMTAIVAPKGSRVATRDPSEEGPTVTRRVQSAPESAPRSPQAAAPQNPEPRAADPKAAQPQAAQPQAAQPRAGEPQASS